MKTQNLNTPSCERERNVFLPKAGVNVFCVAHMTVKKHRMPYMSRNIISFIDSLPEVSALDTSQGHTGAEEYYL